MNEPITYRYFERQLYDLGYKLQVKEIVYQVTSVWLSNHHCMKEAHDITTTLAYNIKKGLN
jgi:hypothetical protein